MAELLAAVDVSIVPLKRSDLFRGALPSKLFEALGAGVGVVAALDGEAKELIEQSPTVEWSLNRRIQKISRKRYSDCYVIRSSVSGLERMVVRTLRVHYNREEIAKRFEYLIGSAVSADLATSIARSDESLPDANPCHLASESSISNLETSKER